MAGMFLCRNGDDYQAVTCTKEQFERIQHVVLRFDLPITVSPVENLDLMEFSDFVDSWRTFDMPETGRDDISAGDLFGGRIGAG